MKCSDQFTVVTPTLFGVGKVQILPECQRKVREFYFWPTTRFVEDLHIGKCNVVAKKSYKGIDCYMCGVIASFITFKDVVDGQ